MGLPGRERLRTVPHLRPLTTARPRSRVALIALCLLSVASAVACRGSPGAGGGTPTSNGTKVGQLVVPKVSLTQQSTYLEDVVEADPSLQTYAESGTTADKALLTDGAAFCAFLGQGRGIDSALTSLAAGAQSIESKTHLPMGVTTFNTIEGVALVRLCPSEQRLLPPADRTQVQKLQQALDGNAG